MKSLVLSGPMASRFYDQLPFIERRYPVDLQVVCYLRYPIEKLNRIVPKGLEPLQLGDGHGVFYITAMRIRGGSVPGPNAPGGVPFDEILWGIQLQPEKVKSYLPQTVLAVALMTSSPEAQAFLRDKDHYHVVRRRKPPDDARLDFIDAITPPTHAMGLEADAMEHEALGDRTGLYFRYGEELPLIAASADGPICTLDLGRTALIEKHWQFLPGPAEVFKPSVVAGGPPLRYEFFFAGLMQILERADLSRNARFEFHPHPLFDLTHLSPQLGNLFDKVTTLQPHVIYVSRPGTEGVQLLTSSSEYRPREALR